MPWKNQISRRNFISSASAAATAGLIPPFYGQKALPNNPTTAGSSPQSHPGIFYTATNALDLSPAKWIWFPAERILPNSFFHFRREIRVKRSVVAAEGWILGDSRYILFCNGKRIQFGPAPSDPRFTEADPVNLLEWLEPGLNVIGATVLYYGFGDGTWPAGKAGFIFRLDVTYDNNEKESWVSDDSWRVQIAQSWNPGKYKRWYLRSLQESYDNRRYPHGWTERSFVCDHTWLPARITGKNGAVTSLNTSISDYLYDSGSPSASQLRRRNIPLITEVPTSSHRLAETHWIKWNFDPENYFDFVVENAFEVANGNEVITENGTWSTVLEDENTGLVMTFEMEEQVVGWPYVEVKADGGTIVELLIQQGHVLHAEGGPALINNNLNSWTRFICRDGSNTFMTFDFESVKWIQLHIRGKGKIRIQRPGVLRRIYPYTAKPSLKTSDSALQKLFDASFNTVLNNSQETIVDCMGRERQQYSGDIGHVIHILHRAFNERRLPERFVRTFSQGLTVDGFFMDSWPAYDRLNRLAQRQLGLTPWGPLLDHSIGFNYDSWYHYLYTGNSASLEEVFPRLVRFFRYLSVLRGNAELLPVENLGVPAVWMDTDSYKLQRHKQCAFNLYAAGMLQDAFSPLCLAFGDKQTSEEALEMSANLVKAVRRNFWSASENMLINNLPWYRSEGELRTCERSISQFILGNFASPTEKLSLKEELIKTPERFGRCYPPNAQWRYWALAHCGEIQPVLDEFRSKWINLPAVQQNNTMPENWTQIPDTHAQYSHAAIAPLYIAYMCVAGIAIKTPGAKRISISPLPGDIDEFSIIHHTQNGAVDLRWNGKKGRRMLQIRVPDQITAELWLDKKERINLPVHEAGTTRNMYLLSGGSLFKENLRFT